MGEKNKIKKYGLIGKNINYSFSKDYFNKKFRKSMTEYWQRKNTLSSS